MKKRIFSLLLIMVLSLGLLACAKKGTNGVDADSDKETNVTTEDDATKDDKDSNENTETGVVLGDDHPYIGTKKAMLKPTDSAPELDGTKDKLYDEVGVKISLDEFNLEYWEKEPLSKSAEAYLTYDKDYLYLYIEVVDDNIDYSGDEVWKKDSVGVILDFGYNREKTEYNGDKIGYVNIACNNTYEYYHEYLKEPYTSMISYKSRVIQRSDSRYVIEMRLPFIEGFNGGKIGFDVTNTDCINGDRCGVRTWNIDGSQMYKYTHCTGTLEFEKNLWKN